MQPIITIEHNDVLFPIPESALAGPPQKSDAEEHDPLELAFAALQQR